MVPRRQLGPRAGSRWTPGRERDPNPLELDAWAFVLAGFGGLEHVPLSDSPELVVLRSVVAPETGCRETPGMERVQAEIERAWGREADLRDLADPLQTVLAGQHRCAMAGCPSTKLYLVSLDRLAPR